MKLKPLAFLFSLIILSVTAFAEEIPSFVLITIPKSGSHMMIKTLYFMTKSPAIWHTKFPSYQYIPPEDGFLYTHFCLSPELEADYRELPDLKKIILIRDLRDVAISMVHQIRKGPWPGLSHEERQEFLKLSFDEQLHFVINYEYDVQDVRKKAPNSLQVSLCKVAEQAERYSQCSDVLTCRYEHLVGAEGGGTLEEQLTELENISLFINLHPSQLDLIEIAGKIYGDNENPFGQGDFANYSSTFKKGKIGGWEQIFTEAHKEAFKKKLGKSLIALGYEVDDNW
jgi:hypothetical protein